MPLPVKIYTLSTCSHCNALKKWLSDCEVKFEFIDVDSLPEWEKYTMLEEIIKINPACSFPTIIIGDNIIVGFRENDIREALGL